MEDFGSKSTSLVPYQSSSPATIPSKELSDVIVNAFNVAADQFTQNIQNNNYTQNNISGNLSGGLADASIAEYYKNLLRQSLEKEEKQKKKDAEEEKKKKDAQRAKEWAEYQKNAQKVIDTMSTWANNPLQGVSDIIDSGFKKVFAGVQTVWNMPLKEVGPNIKKTAKTLFKPITATAEVTGKAFVGIGGAIGGLKKVLEEGVTEQAEELDLDELIQGEDGSYQEALHGLTDQINDVDMDDLLKGETEKNTGTNVDFGPKESKSERDEARQLAAQKNKNDKENSEKQIAATSGVGLTVGGLFTQYILPIVIAVVAIGALLPIVITKMTEGFLTLKNISFPMFIEKIREFFTNAGIDIEARFKEIFSHIPLFGYDPQKELENQKSDAETKKTKAIAMIQQADMILAEKEGILSSAQTPQEKIEAGKRISEAERMKAEGEIAKAEAEQQWIDAEKQIRQAETSGLSTGDMIRMQAEEKKRVAAEESQERRSQILYDVSQKNATMNILAQEQASKYLTEENQAKLVQKIQTEGKSQEELIAANGRAENRVMRGREYMEAWGNFGNNIKVNVVGTGFKNPAGAQ